MANTAQQVFKKIVLHNKLMTAETVDRLLAQMPDPEVAVRFLVKKGKLSEKKGSQLLTLYRAKLAKHSSVSGQGSEKSKMPSASGSSADDAFDAMMSEVIGETSEPESPAPAPVSPPPATPEPEPPTTDVSSANATDDESDIPMLERDTDDDAPHVDSSPQVVSTGQAGVAAGSQRGALSPLIEKILLAARRANASDVHIKSGEVPTLRIAGRLVPMSDHPVISPDACEEALLTMLDDEQRASFLATNDLDFCYDGAEPLGRLRSSFFRQHRGMDGVFRLISSTVPSFEALKMPEVVKKFTEYKQGIVLITGPKGCGKTTTLAAMIDLINSSRPEHIITVEDPIEFVHPCKKGHVNQREVGAHTKNFANALRAALREAPDVIMVGEMRDLETTSLAITAAETGHLVFATLHTPDALRTIDRVLDVFPPKEQGQIRSMLSESLRGIVSQLLVPSVDGKSQELAVEILVNTVAIGNLIREAKTFQLRGVMQTGRRLGMQLMDDSLVTLAKAGKITSEEAIILSTERAQVEKELGGG